ncbi:MAG: O-antigen ligase family protein [Methyloglobulus sp.]|nr:O-antigen ligase family protein [Methyloglobulus sp.]
MAASLHGAQLSSHKNGCYLMALFVVAFFFSTALTTVLSILLGLIWLFTEQYKALPKLLKSQPIAGWSVLMMLCFIIGLSYGNATESEALYSLGKYKKFLFIPVLMVFFHDERYRRWAWLGFTFAAALTVILSDIKAIGIVDLNPHYVSATIKNRITHSMFVAFFAYYCMSKSVNSPRFTKLYWGLCALSLHNLFFVVEGRTGQIAGLALIILFVCQRLSKKGLLVSLVAIAMLMVVFLNFSDKAKRFNEGIVNSKAYLEQNLDPKLRKNSAATRYVFWEYSAKLIAEKPLLGHGTGSFVPQYKRIAAGENLSPIHAHNELFMIGVQLGLLGIIVYLGFIASQYYAASQLIGENKFLAHGFLLTLVITSIFNCPIYDHAQGHWVVTLIALCFAPTRDNSSRENYA